jgi:anti-sigma factor RsiW
MNHEVPNENDLHAYVDGQLSESRCRWLEAYLAVHPDLAKQVQQLKKENQQLRAALVETPSSSFKPHLDPVKIRHALHIRARHRMAIAATLLLSLSVGGLGGWQARDKVLQFNVQPMADAIQAYRLFALEQQSPVVDVVAKGADDIQAWLNQHLVQPASLPDFSRYGFKPLGGRLFATEQGAAAMVLYRDSGGQSIVFYARPSGHTSLGKGNRRDGDLLAQYWSEGRYNYALVSPANVAGTRAVQQAIDHAI